MVCEAAHSYGECNSRDRVAILQIVLASRNLAYVSPGGDDVVAEGVIHPLSNLMAKSVDILDRHGENIRIAVGGNCVGVVGAVCAVISQNAA